eukprot:CAMPEP_0170535668 /NCGR_PEP_ID=MMETSP0209-20121228/101729_1 /TAXON_ID=665100 ORGANISM="Litonotus pictus, Strain P1" /NCGR_SAMPLE_ID=MMETSP0209 /ASSEMBLY_ACC=CAM_ASM_000301 /LENGTH=159 /DNA_ID=CAMNT_0010836961 /DNA_START=597 /DNA_END=1072 /DNA_ORIENTATION=-
MTEQPELSKLIIGIDYGGLEGNETFDYEELNSILDEYRKYGLKCTLHIGETKDFKKIDYTKLLPDRLGHTDYFSEEDAQEIIDLGIPYECCPSSSYTRLGLYSYKDVNLKKYYNKKNSKTGEIYRKFSINTDDTSLFASDLAQEYYEIASSFGINEKEL